MDRLLALTFGMASLLPARYRVSIPCPSTMRLTSATGIASTVPPLALTVVAAKRSEEHTSELQSRRDLVCRLLLEKKKKKKNAQKQRYDNIRTFQTKIIKHKDAKCYTIYI